MVYYPSMASEEVSHLRALRERAGLSVRELARQVGTHHTNLSYWERTGRVGKTEFVLPLAEALGVTAEEVLGRPRPRGRAVTVGGRMGQVFDAASRLPRRQQQKILDIVEPFIREQEAAEASS